MKSRARTMLSRRRKPGKWKPALLLQARKLWTFGPYPLIVMWTRAGMSADSWKPPTRSVYDVNGVEHRLKKVGNEPLPSRPGDY